MLKKMQKCEVILRIHWISPIANPPFANMPTFLASREDYR
jgi:hypothetical protein